MTGSEYCFFHAPGMATQRTQARRDGGRKNKAPVLSQVPDVELDRVSDIVSLISSTISQVRRGELDPKIANCVGYLSSALLRALEADKLEERISALEMAVRNPPAASRDFDDSTYRFVSESAETAQ
jgi:hypothetical protein